MGGITFGSTIPVLLWRYFYLYYCLKELQGFQVYIHPDHHRITFQIIWCYPNYVIYNKHIKEALCLAI